MTAPGLSPAADALRALIRQAGGSIPFERFMEFALYQPEYGYYTRRVRTVGRTGDFSTSATLHPVLAEAVAAWTAARRGEAGGSRAGWHLIELGGGSGDLAAGVIRSLGWWARRGLRYHLVEVSEALREVQRERLAGWSGRVSWHADIRSALEAAGGRALIFSNEFVDAFPCRRLVRGDEDQPWEEIRVAWPEGATAPEERRAAWSGPEDQDDVPLASVLEPESAAGLRPGQQVEIGSAFRRWLRDWLPNWRQGRMLTIDYGDLLPELYHRRPHGTLRAYCRHMRFTGAEVYERIGQQDLTADVNFTDLQRWGAELGLTTTDYCHQAEFLSRWKGRTRDGGASADAALSSLLDPAGAGGAFKVLEQRR